MSRLFGTDGIRGRANAELTADIALSASAAAVRVLREVGTPGRPRAVVGRDPRASGELLEAAVVAGLASAGADVIRLGVLPTPAVAYLTDHLDADLGVMISASHNPMPDNGIKFFARGGVKLADDVEDRIEQAMSQQWERPTGGDVGRVFDDGAAVDQYVQHALSTIGAAHGERPLDGLHVVVDGANGAAAVLSPRILQAAGARVTAIHCTPDGLNINQDCGSTHMADLQHAVVSAGADLGIAHDGDADRTLAVTASGEVIDGDHILAILALAMQGSGTLTHRTLVSTVMANLGLIHAMREAGITVEQTAVGDRYVLERMRAGGFTLGGEQSGHVILAEYATTGDGIITALHVLAQMAHSGRSLADLAGVVTKYPQVLLNVHDVDRDRALDHPAVMAAVAAEETLLGETGRVLLRPSGTEPVVRVMVEAQDTAMAQAVAGRLAEVVRQHCG